MAVTTTTTTTTTVVVIFVVFAGIVGKDIEGSETDGFPWCTSCLGKDSGDNGVSGQDSVVLQTLDCSVGQIHWTTGQHVSHERVFTSCSSICSSRFLRDIGLCGSNAGLQVLNCSVGQVHWTI